MHPLAVQNKKVLVRAQRRTAVIGSLRSSTLKKDIKMEVGSKCKDEEDGLRSKKRSWEAVKEAVFLFEDSGTRTLAISCRRQRHSNSLII